VTVLLVGPLPPPTTGRSVVTASVVEAWRAGGVEVAVADVGLGDGPRALGQLRKLGRYAQALARVAAGGARGGGVVLVASDGPWLAADVLVAVAARLRRRRLAVHHHGWSYVDRRTAPMATLVRSAGPRARHVVLCPAMGEGLRARYGDAVGTVVVSNAGVVPAVEPVVSAGPRLTLGMLGNLDAAKGLLRALDGLDALRADGHDVALVLAGPVLGAEERAAVAAATRRHGDRLEALGPVDPAGRAAFLARCDLLLFPSDYRNESQPMAVLEALAAGVPVVAVERGCLAGDLAGLGWTVPAVDGFGALLADALTALADPAERAARSARAVDRSAALRAESATQLAALATWLTDGTPSHPPNP
jgi:glycosyltransferase involved in cell wall biosynthesis